MRKVAAQDHYAHGHLVEAIRNGVAHLGKTTATVTLKDLAPVDQFHIGGLQATEDLMQQLGLSATDRVLDIGCGLGGPARFVATRYDCHVTGVDVTRDYVAAGNLLSDWVRLSHRVSLQEADALTMPFADATFDAAYMLHVGMNVDGKARLFSEAARVIRRGGLFGIYDVMRTGNGDLTYPVPWATGSETSAVVEPEHYRVALRSAGFEVLAERSRRDFAIAYFQGQSKKSVDDGPPPLGLHILMGERRKDQVRNMMENISTGRISPVEMIARKT